MTGFFTESLVQVDVVCISPVPRPSADYCSFPTIRNNICPWQSHKWALVTLYVVCPIIRKFTTLLPLCPNTEFVMAALRYQDLPRCCT